MLEILVRNEKPQPRGWEFEVTLLSATDRQVHQVSLSCADYDLWCHGRTAPEMVVRAAVRFLLAREPATAIPARFDCAVLRRRFPHADQELPGYLGE